jgi:hypothetical protein
MLRDIAARTDAIFCLMVLQFSSYPLEYYRMGSEPHAKRRFPRFNVNLQVTVYIDSTEVQSRITNLSRGGCLIYPPLGSTPNPEVRLSFLLPDGSRIACKGRVVYEVFDRGTAIAFTEISQYHQERIAEFFESQPA